MSNWTPEELAAQLAANPDLKVATVNVMGQPVAREDAVKIARGILAERKPKAHPHDDFMQQVIDLAHLKGWRVATFRPAQTSKGWRTPVGADGAGWPDLTLARPDSVGPELLFFEVKIPPDTVRPEQQAWLELLGGWVIGPQDWDEIVRLLE